MIVIAGASGKLGQATALELGLRVPSSNIRLLSRTPEKLTDFTARGFQAVRASYDDPHGLVDAFRGAERLLLISATHDFAFPGKRKGQHRAAIAAAKKAGVKHVVYTSTISPHPTAEPSLPDDHYDTELALTVGEIDFSILRHSVYSDALMTMFLPQALATGRYVSSSGKGGIGYVTRADCARVAAAVLVDPPAGRRFLDVTGPESISAAELVAITGEVAECALELVQVPPLQRRLGLIQAGASDQVADFVVSFERMVSQGYLGIATDVANEVTGTPSTSVRAFLMSNRSALQSMARH